MSPLCLLIATTLGLQTIAVAAPSYLAATAPSERSTHPVNKSGATHTIERKPSCCTMVRLIPRRMPTGSEAKSEMANAARRTYDFLLANDVMNAFVESSQQVKAHPRNPLAHYLLGVTLMGLLDYPAATNEFIESLLLDPEPSADAEFMLGQSYRMRGMYDEAIASYKKALLERSNWAVAHALIGECARLQNHYWEMDTECTIAKQADPELPLPHTIMGDGRFAQGHISRGLEDFEAALKLAPDDPYVHFRYGMSLNDVSKLTEAETELRKALELDPAYPEATLWLAWILAREKKFPEAIEFGKKAVLLAPHDVDTHYALGRIYSKAGNPDAAVTAHKQARTLRPDNLPIQRALAMALAETHNLDEAIVELSALSQEFPLDESLKLQLGAILQLRKKQRSGK